MTSKVGKKLFLSGNGRTVAVTGPITRWEPGETSAKFAVVIAQATDDGAILSAYGAPDEVYGRGSAGWDAKASVEYDSPPLTPGPATAFAVAAIQNGHREPEMYYWSVPVTLRVRERAAAHR